MYPNNQKAVVSFAGRLLERLREKLAEETLTPTPKRKSNYKPTGFPRGRPRQGEIRPPSPAAQRHARYIQKRLATDPFFREQLNEYQRQWVKNNPMRAKEIAKATNLRKRKWKKANAVDIPAQMVGNILIEATNVGKIS